MTIFSTTLALHFINLTPKVNFSMLFIDYIDSEHYLKEPNDGCEVISTFGASES